MDIIVNNIPTELAQRITRAADAGGLSVNAYIRRAVEEMLEPVDPVHAAGGVYCRECRFWEKERKLRYLEKNTAPCHWSKIVKEEDDFCSDGETIK